MKNVFLAALMASLFTGVTVAQAQGGPTSKATALVPVAVVEFTPGPKASSMTFEAKRQLQASIAFSLHDSRRVDVYDVRRTREASKASLAAVNDETATDAAVKVGQQLGVSYVVTGIVTEYTPNGEEGFGFATLRTRLIEVATGKVIHSGETVQKGTSAMRGTNAQEMQAKVLKPASEKLAETILAKF